MMKLPVFSLSLIALAISNTTHSETMPSRFDRSEPSQSDFGGVGLLQMPSARMARDGEFSASYHDSEEYRRWAASVQIYDWLETTLRYTDTRTKPYSYNPGFSGDQSHKDKGIDFKFKLLDEGYWVPQTVFGVRDFAGTGLFDSEYLAASKRWGDIDFTLGIGWGNMAESANISNPFCNYKESFCVRPGFNGIPGDFELGNMFHGSAALFGGIEYQTPWKPLRVKVEYDGNDYSQEYAGVIHQSTPINVGLVYKATSLLDTTISYQRGNTLMWGFSLQTNFNDIANVNVDEPRHEYQAKSDVDKSANWDEVGSALTNNAGISNPEIYVDDKNSVVTVIGEQKKYRYRSEADQRASIILNNSLTDTADTYKFIDTREGLPVEQRTVVAEQLKAKYSGEYLGQQGTEVKNNKSPEPIAGNMVYSANKSPFDYSFTPTLQQSWGGPEAFYLYQLGLNTSADFHVNSNMWLTSTVYWNWVDNFDKFNYTAPPNDGTDLPRVRTHVREYVASSDLLLNNLQASWMDELKQDLYAQAYTGYLEMMYAGAGAEFLYRPYGASWALGVDGNYVRQRDWNNTLKLADYTAKTGHATLYWQVPLLESTLAKISVGQYLAEDKGFTLDLSRRFDSGIIAGAFATITDVSAEEYGEGSFTKGFYVSIPLDLLLVHPTTRVGSIAWIPLTRDGGQMLGRKYGLYTLTEPAGIIDKK